MKVAVFGLGYVGTVTAAALARDGHEVVGVDVAAQKIDAIASGNAPVLEPGLDPINPLDAWGTGNGSDDIFVECVLALDSDPSTGLSLFAVDLPPADDDF